jgi:hypothetical protein
MKQLRLALCLSLTLLSEIIFSHPALTQTQKTPNWAHLQKGITAKLRSDGLGGNVILCDTLNVLLLEHAGATTGWSDEQCRPIPTGRFVKVISIKSVDVPYKSDFKTESHHQFVAYVKSDAGWSNYVSTSNLEPIVQIGTRIRLISGPGFSAAYQKPRVTYLGKELILMPGVLATVIGSDYSSIDNTRLIIHILSGPYSGETASLDPSYAETINGFDLQIFDCHRDNCSAPQTN